MTYARVESDVCSEEFPLARGVTVVYRKNPYDKILINLERLVFTGISNFSLHALS